MLRDPRRWITLLPAAGWLLAFVVCLAISPGLAGAMLGGALGSLTDPFAIGAAAACAYLIWSRRTAPALALAALASLAIAVAADARRVGTSLEPDFLQTALFKFAGVTLVLGLVGGVRWLVRGREPASRR